MSNEVDILENDLREQYPEVLDILLRDHTTQKNIFWATNNYQYIGKDYDFASPILPEHITGERGNVIMPRVKKIKTFNSHGYAIWQKCLLPPGFATLKTI